MELTQQKCSYEGEEGQILWNAHKDHIITRDIFKRFSQCQQVKLLNQNITDIQDGALSLLLKASGLYLSNNNLKSLRRAMFQGGISNELYWLDVSHNSISFIEKSTFSNLGRLGRLYLHHNPIGAGITPETFAGLSKWFTLDLSYTNIAIVPGLFQFIPKLKRLILNGNRFQYVPRMWEGLRLEELWLGEANITDPNKEMWQNLGGSLRTLVLKGNNIVTLKANSFQGLKRLTVLSLTECGIQNVEAKAFEGAPELAVINLWYNPLLKLDENIFGITTQNWPNGKSCELMLGPDVFQCTHGMCWLQVTTLPNNVYHIETQFELFQTKCENVTKYVIDFLENDCL